MRTTAFTCIIARKFLKQHDINVGVFVYWYYILIGPPNIWASQKHQQQTTPQPLRTSLLSRLLKD